MAFLTGSNSSLAMFPSSLPSCSDLCIPSNYLHPLRFHCSHPSISTFHLRLPNLWPSLSPWLVQLIDFWFSPKSFCRLYHPLFTPTTPPNVLSRHNNFLYPKKWNSLRCDSFFIYCLLQLSIAPNAGDNTILKWFPYLWWSLFYNQIIHLHKFFSSSTLLMLLMTSSSGYQGQSTDCTASRYYLA